MRRPVFIAWTGLVLGEAAAFHFYTWEDIPVKSEVLYRTLQNQKWFVSKNTNAAMQLFFSGADCTVPGETDWEKLRAVIDYAHTWRQTHKK